MSQLFSQEEIHRNLLSRIPRCTGRDISDWLRTLADAPASPRLEDRVGWLRREYHLAYGHAKAIAREYELRRSAGAH
ncbi:DUF4287 domain-containing protein [Streptomyces carminius]|uniref:DUF4287 domain-containing protein n=1 Tax=Streptomyces carminius TaxID=2665496 RepID=A0A2M8LUP1_9ACTN|nr:DUF4287 domain-containing protein [Streptomyces carminius]PJE95664.1 DUF4287 domain-containing protein [Streptomyces carminius]